MIPKNITEHHILQAIMEIDTNGITYPLTQSTRYDLLYENKTYPPKLTISLANRFANGIYLTHDKFDSREARNYLEKLNPSFIIQMKTNNLQLELISKYKEHIQAFGFGDEIYKWNLLGLYKGRPDITNKNLYEELHSIKFVNLIYHDGIRTIEHMAKDKTEQLRACFFELFDETKAIDLRIKYFNEKTLNIYRELVPEKRLSHHQDERTMATYLTYHNPEKYTFYKSSFYLKYCKLLNIKAKSKNEKYVHYLELINTFIEEYINEDAELLNLVYSFIPKEAFQDENHLILAQDILYRMLDKNSEIEEVIGLMASDSTGWQMEHIQELSNFDACIIWNSKRPSGTDETLKFLRNVIDEKETFNLYYCAGGVVNYKATILDYAENQKQLDEKAWDKNIQKIMYYHSKFEDYVDKNKKASIVFLAENLEKINPIPISHFKFYKGFETPRQDNLSPIKFEPEIEFEVDKPKEENNSNTNDKPLNQILFGPPGTGKTYNTINKAIEIVDPIFYENNKNEREKITERFRILQFDKEKKTGQIGFITFHQSMSYEDFIEGIKPHIEYTEEDDDDYIENSSPLEYRIIPGIFKEISQKAKLAVIAEVNFDTLWSNFYNHISKSSGEVIFTSTTSELKLEKELSSESSIKVRFKKSFDPAFGEGKSIFHVGKETVRRIFDNNINLADPELKKWVEIKKIVGAGRASYFYAVYKSFFEYSRLEEIFKKADSTLPHILIIDEINRGNVSQIFGELITLIEDDKRLGKEEALEVILPYSKMKFGVPSNLYIIGTMNTADRSVEALDAALRRRFSFEEMPPLYHLEALNYEYAGCKVSLILETINKRIEKLLDKDHAIGHSYFLIKDGEKPEDKIKYAFYRNIIPLLQEYFFGDYGKIGMVIGRGFIQLKEWNNNEISFAKFDTESSIDFDEREVYEILDYTKQEIHSIKIKNSKGSTYNLVEINFENAIQILMNKEIE